MLEKQQLLEKIKDLENELKKIKSCKRYWLVFEEKTEQFEEKAKNALPLLKEEKELEISIPSPNGRGLGWGLQDKFNLIIEWDNFHSLSCLQFTHKNKIDVIYIDPPYNTWNKDFIYNDSFVDKEDSFRHSKWLSFMKKRLVLGKELLSEKWVIFISIDDNEFTQLKMLCDEIFWENNTDVMIWRKSWEWRDWKMKNTTTFRKDHEYIICCWKREKYLNKISEIPNFQNEYWNPDKDKRWPYKAWSISRKEEASNSNHKNYYTLTSPSWKNFTRQFDISKNDFEKLDKDWRIYWGKSWDAVPAIKIFINEKREITPYSIFLNKWTTTEWSEQLNKIMCYDLTYFRAKPSFLIKTLVQLWSSKSSIILDFFAWSWTTWHAVLELNREDWWNRQFILCSNRENTKENFEKNICKNITYERNKRVIQGYTNSKWEKVNWLWWNLKYYTTDFIKIDKSREDLKTKFKNNCNDLLCIKENTFTKVELKKEIPWVYIFKNDSSFTIISYEQIYLQEIRDICKILNKKVNIYIFSLSNYFSEDFIDIKDSVEIKNIPETILETYQKIFNF